MNRIRSNVRYRAGVRFLASLFRRICLSLCFCHSANAIPNPVPTNAIEVQVNADVNVAAEQIVLGDVATIYTKDLANFKSLSSLVLSRMPDDKGEMKLPASYLEARIRAALPADTEFALRAPGEINFHLKRLGISAQDFASEIGRLARAANKVPASAELEVTPLSGIELLKGLSLSNARIEPQAEIAQWKGDLSFKVSRNDSSAPPLWVRAKVRWFQQAWVAAKPLAFNEQPVAASFSQGRVETTAFREEPVTGNAEELALLLQGSKLRRSMPANAPLVASALERKPDATAGSSLRVVFVSESGVRVSADGLLVGSGSIGADVKARLKSSKKMVTGKLVSQNVVEVSL